MKVTSNVTTNSTLGSETAIELKEGENYTAVIKDRLSKDEAIVQIRGKDIQVKFADGIPKGDRITIQVMDIDGKLPMVKPSGDVTISGQLTGDQELAQIIRALGSTVTSEMKQAIKLAMSFDTTVNHKVIDILKSFLTNADGNDQQKLDTIKALLTKNIELNLQNLKAIHSALNEKPIADLLIHLVNKQDQKQSAILQMISLIKMEKSHSEQVSQSDHLGRSQHAHENVEKENARTQFIKNDQAGNDRMVMQQHTSSIHALESTTSSKNEVPSQSDQVRALNQSVRGSMEEVINILQNLQEYEENEYLQNFPNLSAKEFIITAVTQKLAEVTDQFKHIQRDITRNLDNLQLAVQQARGNILPHIKPLLESTIDLIDKAILKSEIMLFTDMKTEKTLLQASGHLADARRLLSKGDYVGARQILEDVKQTIRNLDFRPVDVKVQHYISKAIFDSQPISTEQKMNAQLENVLAHQQNIGSSSRATFELVRSLGLNYESEIAQSLSLRNEHINQDDIQRNLKAAILQLLKGDHEHQQPRTMQEAPQILNHLTGQQLLSKSDIGSNLQSLFFNIPITIGRQVENLQVMINSKQDGQKIDWENCSIYFLIETKKMGETGILLTATDRNLAITLKNDQLQFKDRMEGLVSKYKDRLQDIGYNIKSVQFTKLNSDPVQREAKQEQKLATPPSSISASKGFDFKI